MDKHGFTSSTYGDGFAEVYDDWYDDAFDTDGAVRRLSSIAGEGRILELGIGTGRIAIPLAAAPGVEVWGVDSSAKMLERLRAKPGAEVVHELQSDASQTLPDGPFDVVFASYNTFFNLDSEQKRSCLRLVADRLAGDGTLVIEAFVPDTDGVSPSGGVDVRSVAADHVVLGVHTTDPASGEARGQFVEISSAGIEMRPWQVHYLAPDALDALCADFGFALAERTQDWAGSPFVETSTQHVSLYRARNASSH